MQARANVLIIDDDPKVREMLSDILRARGYVTTTASQGRTAIDIVQQEPQAVALIDLVLGDMSGLLVVKEIRERCPDTECIVLTGHATRVSAIEAVNLGAYGYLQKPYDVEQLLVTIRRAIEKQEAAKALRESEERYRAIFEQAADSIVLIDAETWALIDFNDRAHESLGYTREEFQELRIPDVEATDYAEETARRIEKIVNEGFDRFETKLRTKSGEIREFELSGRAIRIGGGNYVQCICRDITERKRTEDELRQSEGRLRSLVENAPDAIIVVDLAGRFIDVNAQTEVLLGFSSEELIGRTPFELALLPDPYVPMVRAGLQRNRRGEATGPVEYELIRKDGSRVEVEVKTIPMWTRGRVEVTVILRDISERKQAEEALRESERSYRQLLEVIHEGIWIIDKDACTTYVNPRMAEMLGYTVEEMLGRHLFSFTDERGAEIAAVNLQRRERGIEEQHDFEFLRKDGTRVYTTMGTSPITDSSGNYIGAIAGVHDITKRKRAEDELQERTRDLGERVKELGCLYAISRLAGNRDIPIDEMLQGAVDLIPPAWQYPEITCARIIIEGREFRTSGFRESIWRQTQDITVHGNRTGSIEVHFLEERPEIDEGPFLKEERDLITAIAEEVARAIERREAEEALRQSEEKLHIMFESVVEGISVTDMGGTILDVNQALLNLHGYSGKEQIVGRRAADFIAQRDRGRVTRMRERTLAEGFSAVEECVLLRNDGTEFDAEVSSAVLRDDSGNAEGFIAVTRDISERKEIEKALHDREERFRELIENASDILLILDSSARIRYASPSCERLMGYGQEELVGKNIFEFVHPEEAPGAASGFARVVREPSTARPYELHFRHKDGTWRLFECIGKSIVGDSGDANVIVNARDITDRKRAEEELLHRARREEALHAVAATMSQSADLEKALNVVLEQVMEAAAVQAGYVASFDMETRTGAVKAHRGLSAQFLGNLGGEEIEEDVRRWRDYREPAFGLQSMYSDPVRRNKVLAAAENEGLQSFVAVPLWAKDVLHGALVLAARSPRHFTPQELELLQAIANEIAVGIENARLLEKTLELSVTDELTGLHNRRYFYEALEAEIARTQRYGRSFSLAIVDLDGFKQYNDRFGHTNGDAILKALARTLRSSLRKSDIAFRYGGDEFAIILPVTDADRAMTIVDRIRKKWMYVREAERTVLETPLDFSAGIAAFPESAETGDGLVFLADTALYHSKRAGGCQTTLVSGLGIFGPDVLDRATLDQVYALAATVDARDPYTYGHSSRVADVSQMIGRAIRLSQEELAALHAASLLHDIGKVGVPDAILTKPGKPTEEEWELIRKHPTEGARIVGYVKELAPLVSMIRHHHEWYDGKGYPDGLEGEDIPLGARIISIADAYDTMTTKRTYRDIVSQGEALEELKRASGTQFAPEFVEVLCREMGMPVGGDETPVDTEPSLHE